MLGVVLLVALLVVLYLVARWRHERAEVLLWREATQLQDMPALGAGTPGPAAEAEPDEYRALLTMVLGDRQQVERLLEYEARLAPDADRPQLIASAIERLRDDRQRYG